MFGEMLTARRWALRTAGLLVGLALFSLLVGCASTVPGKRPTRSAVEYFDYNPQNFQSGTVVLYYGEDAWSSVPEGETPYPVIAWWDFKDKDNLSVSADLNADGTPDFAYSVSRSEGTTRAQVRADVEKRLAEMNEELAGVGADALVDLVCQVSKACLGE